MYIITTKYPVIPASNEFPAKHDIFLDTLEHDGKQNAVKGTGTTKAGKTRTFFIPYDAITCIVETKEEK